jgi:hypothetical protein
MSLKDLETYLIKTAKSMDRHAKKEREEIDVNDAIMSFASMSGSLQGAIDHDLKGTHPALKKRLIQTVEDFYEETQDEKNWEDGGRWGYPTHENDLYEAISGLTKDLLIIVLEYNEKSTSPRRE